MAGVEHVKGKIRLADGTESEFIVSDDGAWQQWGANRERLGVTVVAVEAIAAGLLSVDCFAEEEGEGHDD